MDDETALVIDRLRRSDSPSLRLLVDAANLDDPVEAEPEPQPMVEPYRWLLNRVGDGLRLTKTGYLPPSVLRAAMTALGWDDSWNRPMNREDLVYPVFGLRESAQRFGLLHTNDGRLALTPAGRRVMADPAELWWHIADQLPWGKTEARRAAGVAYLLGIAAGWPTSNALLAEAMLVLGWAEPEKWAALSEITAFVSARDTWSVFDRLRLSPAKARPDVPGPPPSAAAIRLARAALIGRPA